MNMELQIDKFYNQMVGIYSDNEYIIKYRELIEKYLKLKLKRVKGKHGQVERHHIVPKFWFKINNIPLINKTNLVGLPPKQHFWAHWWLYKFFFSIDPSSRESYCASIPVIKSITSSSWGIDVSILNDQDIEYFSEIYDNFKKYHKYHISRRDFEEQSAEMKERCRTHTRMFNKVYGNLLYVKNEEVEDYKNNGYITENEYTKYKIRVEIDDILHDRRKLPDDEHKRNVYAHTFLDRVYKHIKDELTDERIDELYMKLYGRKRTTKKYSQEKINHILSISMDDCRKEFHPNCWQHIRQIRRNAGIDDPYSEKCSWYYHPVTDEEREFYKTHTVDECMEKFNRSRSTIVYEQKKLGVFVSSKDPEYSKEDDEYIINHTTYECVEHFPNRTYEALAQRKRAITPPELFKKQKLQDMKVRPKFNGLIKVDQYTTDGQFIRTFDSIAEAQKTLNIKHLSSVISGKRKTSGGFVWKRHIET